ncbi:MAG TPA: hypothetical protein VFE24_16020, partial [Pirellulales bacterium]|nr:hypothetical protein [Pirellulales bacterium]
VASKFEQYDDQPQDTMRRAVYELLRGNNAVKSTSTNYLISSIAGHSILENMYGDISAYGSLASVPTDVTGSNGQLKQVLLTNLDITRSKTPIKTFNVAGIFNGCVLTVVDGPISGSSARVVNYLGDSSTFWVLPIDADFAQAAAGNHVVVNGRQFSGTGPGFNLNTGITDALDDSGRPLALVPNCAATPGYLQSSSNYAANAGGMNPDYTAPDYNTMFLAWRPATIDNGQHIIPSFHRPALINYWLSKGAPDEKLWNKMMLRPNKISHPIFAATVNPQFDPVKGPWDVDNLGTGVPDSVWVDVGFPIQTHKDGRLFKPLVAYLVLDMDGRLNVNAHGNPTQLSPQSPPNGAYAGNTPPSPLTRGLGIGPAEVDLTKALTTTEAQYLMQGSGSNEGRYGKDGVPNITGRDPTQASSPLSPFNYKFFEYPADYYGGAPSSFGSPPDLTGNGFVAIDLLGQPLFGFMGVAGATTSANNPYLTNLSPLVGRPSKPSGSTIDNLFTPADLEAILRLYDIDARSLPTRLTTMLSLPANGLNAKSEFKPFFLTTDSNDVPGPSPIPTSEMRNNIGTNRWALQIMDLLRYKLEGAGLSPGPVEKRQLALMLPPELMAGVKMNINRPFGDGRDSNNNKVVDDPGEAGTDSFANLNNDTAITNPKFARQLEARHLYILLMLLTDQGYVIPTTEATLNAAQQKELTAQRLAQWAINVVDFKDPDSIMSPFEYLVTPFTKNGWNVDGDPATNEATSGTAPSRRVVWGCESPDLLLMGGLAFHDRRVKDTDNDDGKSPGHAKPGSTLDDAANTGKNKDPDMDQIRIPQGSAFFKLYCPANQNGHASNTLAPELYTNNQLDLEKLSPAAADGKTYPVWRIAISTSTKKESQSDVRTRLKNSPDSTSLQPDRMSLLDASATPTDIVNIERIVWFSTTSPLPNSATTAYYYNRGGAGSAHLKPGQYLLVGPRDKTWIGSKNDGSASSQEIDINPTVQVVGGANGAAANIQPAVGIVCAADRPAGWGAAGGPPNIGLNISEPLPSDPKYYQQPNQKWPSSPYAYNDAYGVEGDMNNQFPDAPFDSAAGMPLKTDNMLETGTYLNARTVFLQRLANPLEGYNKDTNPYITVDWMPLDLTVFNGENQTPNQTSATPDPDDKTPGTANPVRFAERLRGLKAPPGGAPPTDLFWQAISDDPDPTAKDGSTNNFSYKLVHCFAYLNRTYGTPTGTNASYLGAPSRPFPWLTWNNRPFASPYELMMVPCSSPGRLTSEFNLPTMVAAGNVYNSTPTGANARYPFNHLLNFFQSNSMTPPPATQPCGNLYRLFECVGVPSPFIGTETWLNASSGFSLQYFQPPFNYVSNYRDPGKINLNTINSVSVFAALMSGSGMSDAQITDLWNRFQNSRAGYSLSSGYASDTNAAFPTNFVGAFRAPTGADQVPLPALRREGVQATLLRSDPNSATSPLFMSASTQDSNSTSRNPYFAYQGIDRLANLVTTRSNVFAVWVTVGYFECVPYGKVDPFHPDGYQLGGEIDSDRGDVKRHRAFYLIDRSIPVGFERGQDYNVNKAIVLQRFIE